MNVSASASSSVSTSAIAVGVAARGVGALLVFSGVLVLLVLGVYYVSRSLTERERRSRVYDDSKLVSRLALWFVAWWAALSSVVVAAASTLASLATTLLNNPVALGVGALFFVASIVVRETQQEFWPAASEAYSCIVTPFTQTAGLALANTVRLTLAALVPIWDTFVRVTNAAVFGALTDAVACGAKEALAFLEAALAVFESAVLALSTYLTSGSLVTTPLEAQPFGVAVGVSVATLQGYVQCVCASFSLYTLPFFAAFTGADAVGTLAREYATHVGALDVHARRAAAFAAYTPPPGWQQHQRQQQQQQQRVRRHGHRTNETTLESMHDLDVYLGQLASSSSSSLQPVPTFVFDGIRLLTTGVDPANAFATAVNKTLNAPLALLQGTIGHTIEAIAVLVESGFTDWDGAYRVGRWDWTRALNNAAEALVAAGTFVDTVVANYYELFVGIGTDSLGSGALYSDAERALLPYPYGPERPPFLGVVAGHALSVPLKAVGVVSRWVFHIDVVLREYDGALLWRFDPVYDEIVATARAFCRFVHWLGDGMEAQARANDGQAPVCPPDAGRCDSTFAPSCAVPGVEAYSCSFELNASYTFSVPTCVRGLCLDGVCLQTANSEPAYVCSCSCTPPLPVCRPGGDAGACAQLIIADVLRDACCLLENGIALLLRLLKNVLDTAIGSVYALVATIVTPPGTCTVPVTAGNRSFCSLPLPSPGVPDAIAAPLRYAHYYWGDRDRCDASLCGAFACTSSADCAFGSCDTRYGRCLVADDGCAPELVGAACEPDALGDGVCVARTCDVASACTPVNASATYPCTCQCYGVVFVGNFNVTSADAYAEPVNEYALTVELFVNTTDCVARLLRDFGAAIDGANASVTNVTSNATTAWEPLACLVSATGRVIGEAWLLAADLVVHADIVLYEPDEFEADIGPLLDELEAGAHCVADFLRTLFDVIEEPHPHEPTYAFGDCFADAVVQLVRALVQYVRAIVTVVANLWTGYIEDDAELVVHAFERSAELGINASTAVEAALEDAACMVISFVPNTPCVFAVNVTDRLAVSQSLRYPAFVVGQLLALPFELFYDASELGQALVANDTVLVEDAIDDLVATIVFFFVDITAGAMDAAADGLGCYFQGVQAELHALALELRVFGQALVDAIDSLIYFLFLLFTAIIGVVVNDLAPLFRLIEHIFEAFMLHVVNLITPNVACYVQEAICAVFPLPVNATATGVVPGWQFCYQVDAQAQAIIKPPITTPFLNSSVCAAGSALCYVTNSVLCSLSIAPISGCPPCSVFPGPTPAPTMARKRALDASGNMYPSVRTLLPELDRASDAFAPMLDDVCRRTYAARLDERWPALHVNDTLVAEACFYAYAPAAYARANGASATRAPLPATLSLTTLVFEYSVFTLSMARALAADATFAGADAHEARKRTFIEAPSLASFRLGHALADARRAEVRAAPARRRTRHARALAVERWRGLRARSGETYARTRRIAGNVPMRTATRATVARLWTRASAFVPRVRARALPFGAAARASVAALVAPRTALAAAVRDAAVVRARATVASVRALAHTARTGVRLASSGIERTNSTTSVDALSPFACIPHQFLCTNCSWLDRIFAYLQEDFVNSRFYYTHTYPTSTLERARAVSARVLAYQTSGAANTDTFATSPKTVEPLGALLANVTWFWQWNWTGFVHSLRPLPNDGTLVVASQYIADQLAANRTSANVQWFELSNAIVNGSGTASVGFGAEVAAYVRHLFVEATVSGHALVDQHLVCNATRGHYCRTGATPEQSALNLLSGLANIGLLVLALVTLAAVVPAVACGSYALVLGIALVLVPLALAIAYQSSPLCYTPSIVTGGLFALAPNVLTALGMLPALPVCLGDDGFALYDAAAAPCFPYPVTLIEDGDVRAANSCSRCGVPAPRAKNCARHGFVSGYDNIFYMLEVLVPGFNEAFVSSSATASLAWLRAIAAEHTAAKNAAEPAAAACNLTTILDTFVALTALVLALSVLAAATVFVGRLLWALPFALLALAALVAEALHQITEGYLDKPAPPSKRAGATPTGVHASSLVGRYALVRAVVTRGEHRV